MRKIGLFIVFCVLIASFVLAGNNVKVYFNDWNYQYICISTDTLTFYNQVTCSPSPVFYPVGVCSCTNLSDSIVELNSITGEYPDIWDNVEITTTKRSDNEPTKTTRLILSTPHCDIPLIADITYDSSIFMGNVTDTIVDGNATISVPSAISTFSITLAPSFYNPSNVYLQYFGKLYYTYIPEGSYSDCSQISIVFNEVSVFQFSQYYLKGEYLRLIDGGLLWKGQLYKEIADDFYETTIKPNVYYEIPSDKCVYYNYQ